jgi:hypothetical protein
MVQQARKIPNLVEPPKMEDKALDLALKASLQASRSLM